MATKINYKVYIPGTISGSRIIKASSPTMAARKFADEMWVGYYSKMERFGDDKRFRFGIECPDTGRTTTAHVTVVPAM